MGSSREETRKVANGRPLRSVLVCFLPAERIALTVIRAGAAKPTARSLRDTTARCGKIQEKLFRFAHLRHETLARQEENGKQLLGGSRAAVLAASLRRRAERTVFSRYYRWERRWGGRWPNRVRNCRTVGRILHILCPQIRIWRSSMRRDRCPGNGKIVG
jgi:hypothetical protein